jgi:O-methyltransferase
MGLLLIALLLIIGIVNAAVHPIELADAEGTGWAIFHPAAKYDLKHSLLQPPEGWISELIHRIKYLDYVTGQPQPGSPLLRARLAYTEMLLQFLSGAIFGTAERSVYPQLRAKTMSVTRFNPEIREKGNDWTYLGLSMSGKARLHNVEALILDVIERNITGHYIETGVWRGGSSIFARGMLRAYEQGHRRMNFVCDSFSGLPPGDNRLHSGEEGYDGSRYLEVDPLTVARNFHTHGLLDVNVVFVQGFFNNTMAPLSHRIGPLAIMRLDGDMYVSTVDVLYNLYEKLAVGGYVIIDDWADNFGAKNAVLDFMDVHDCHDLNEFGCPRNAFVRFLVR